MSEDSRPAINDVLMHYDVPVKDRRSYNTSCPFHQDKTPSLSVQTEKNVWSCKSCGQHGDSYTLIALKEGVPISEFRRVTELAASLGFAAGGTGGGGGELRGSGYGGRRTRAPRSGDRPKRGGYKPAWRRS